MTPRLLLPALLLILAGCSTTQQLPPELAARIPDGANVITLYSDQSPTTFLAALRDALAVQGYQLDSTNARSGMVVTQFKPLSRESALRIIAFVAQRGTGSAARFWGHASASTTFGYTLTQSLGGVESGEAERAAWSGSYSRTAFGALALFAERLPHTEITYLKE
jgi:hypothetical protein